MTKEFFFCEEWKMSEAFFFVKTNCLRQLILFFAFFIKPGQKTEFSSNFRRLRTIFNELTFFWFLGWFKIKAIFFLQEKNLYEFLKCEIQVLRECHKSNLAEYFLIHFHEIFLCPNGNENVISLRVRITYCELLHTWMRISSAY